MNPQQNKAPQTVHILWDELNIHRYIEGLVQDCSNSSALAMELLQSCTNPSIYDI